MSLQNPSASAYFFTIVDNAGTRFEAYFELKLITDFYAWQVWFKREDTDDEYTRLSTSNHSGGSGSFQISLGDEGEINRLFSTPMEQNIEMFRVTEGYTDVIINTFGAPSQGTGERPVAAFDAFNWLVKNKVVNENNELKFKVS